MNRIRFFITFFIAAGSTLFLSTASLAQQIHPGVSGEELLEALQRDYHPQNVLGYAEARREMFSDIDNVDGEVMLVYTGRWFETDDIPDHTFVNTEHTWPQSRFEDERGTRWMKTDLHHLFPVYNSVNSSRGNSAFGEIPDQDTARWWGDSFSETRIPTQEIERYSEAINSVFEPREAHKGNVARALFYFRTVYGDRNIDTPWFNAQLNTLLAWHVLDPVDDAERSRTVRIGAIQGTENPFVLDESLAERAFSEVPLPRERAMELLTRASPPHALMRDAPGIARAARDGEPVRIVSWNIREIFSLRSVNRRRNELHAFAQDLRPDILLLQEITSLRQVERIRDAMGLTGYYFACTDFNQNDTNQHSSFEVGIISRFPLTTLSENDPTPDNSPDEIREFPLTRPEIEGIADVNTSRGFLRVRIEDLNMIINVVHLKSANGEEGYHDRSNAQKRELVAAAVADQVNRDLQYLDDYTVLVVGDFNVGETDERKNGRSLMQDCYEEDCGNQDRYDDTHAIFSEGLVGGLRMVSKTVDLGMETYDSRNFEGSGPIDCLYVTGTGEARVSPARRAMSTFGSDHFAIWSVYTRPDP